MRRSGRKFDEQPLRELIHRGEICAQARRTLDIRQCLEPLLQFGRQHSPAVRATPAGSFSRRRRRSPSEMTPRSRPESTTAVKTSRDPSRQFAQLEKMMGQRGKPVLDFLEHVRRGSDPVQARAQLPKDFDLRLRLQAIHAAVIMLDRRAPDGWRDEAARGLFVGERGYLRTL